MKVPSTILTLLLAVSATAEDWPRWQGADNQANWKAAGILEHISQNPDDQPIAAWRVPVGLGYSGPAVANGRVYLMDYAKSTGEIANNPSGKNQLEGKERVRCFDLATGNELWSYEYDRPYFLSYAAGPRCTTTIADGKVYALGAEGNLTCLEAESGELVWKKDLVREYGVETPIWGFSAHPLVVGDTLYCIVGGEGSVAVAFDRDTGKEKWRALSAVEAGYCPPTMIRHAGVDQLIIWHAQAINSLNPVSGEVYWTLPLKPSYGMSIMSPRKAGNFLFASAIGRVGALIELDPNEPKAEIAWTAKPKDAVFVANSTPYLMDGHIYGVDIDTSALICARMSDGERIWSDASPIVGENPAPRGTRHGTAFLTRNTSNGLFYLFNERGELVIAELSPEGYSERGRLHLLEPTNEAFGRPVVWSAPAFAGRSILVRNDRELAKFDLGK